MNDQPTEPRYLVKEDVLVWDLHHMKAGCHPARIVDVSRNGMHLESNHRFPRGSHVAIDFRGMTICGAVQHCSQIENRFAMGIRIKELLDPLREEPADHSADENICVEVAAALP